MNRLTYRDNKGRPRWAPEIKADGFDVMIRRTVAEYEDRLEKIDSMRTGRHPKAVVAAAPDGSITEYPSVKAAARSVNAHPGQISVACTNGKPFKGFTWDYKEDKHG